MSRRPPGAGRQRGNRNGIAEHIEELNTIIGFVSCNVLALDDADIAGKQSLFQHVALQNDVVVKSNSSAATYSNIAMHSAFVVARQIIMGFDDVKPALQGERDWHIHNEKGEIHTCKYTRKYEECKLCFRLKIWLRNYCPGAVNFPGAE